GGAVKLNPVPLLINRLQEGYNCRRYFSLEANDTKTIQVIRIVRACPNKAQACCRTVPPTYILLIKRRDTHQLIAQPGTQNEKRTRIATVCCPPGFTPFPS